MESTGRLTLTEAGIASPKSFNLQTMQHDYNSVDFTGVQDSKSVVNLFIEGIDLFEQVNFSHLLKNPLD